jgi:hypothetical protein
MNKLVVAVLIISSTVFSSANGQNYASHSIQAPLASSIPTVSLGELIKHSGKYKNQEVRIRAVYHSWFEGSELSETANGYEGMGVIWVDFSDSVKSRSTPEVVQNLEEINFRPQVDGNGKVFGEYYDWQTEMVVTGKIYKSGKRRFGLHGGYKYAFVVTSVEEVGTLKKFDGLTMKYVE